MKKRIVSLLLMVCMLFTVATVAHAYDINGKYKVELRMNYSTTFGTLFVPCGSPEITVEYKWSTDPANSHNYGWILHVNGQKIPSRGGSSYGWSNKALATATGIPNLTGLDYVAKNYAVIQDGKPDPLAKSFTVPKTGKGTWASQSFRKNAEVKNFSIKFVDKSNKLLSDLSYPMTISVGQTLTIDSSTDEELRAYLSDKGYIFVPLNQNKTISCTYDSTGKSILTPEEVTFVVTMLEPV